MKPSHTVVAALVVLAADYSPMRPARCWWTGQNWSCPAPPSSIGRSLGFARSYGPPYANQNSAGPWDNASHSYDQRQ
jgi:hypothetical protein